MPCTDYSLGLRSPTFHPLLGSGIFTQDGAAWRHSRQLLRPQFASNRVQNYYQIKACVDSLISRIPEDGIVDLQPHSFKLTFDTTMFLLFGPSVEAEDWDNVAGQEAELAKSFNLAQEYLAYRGRLGGLYWLLDSSKFRSECRECHRFVDVAVAKALEASKNHVSDKQHEEKKSYVFVHALTEQTKDPQIIRDQYLNLLLAGRDTTGCCLQWTL